MPSSLRIALLPVFLARLKWADMFDFPLFPPSRSPARGRLPVFLPARLAVVQGRGHGRRSWEIDGSRGSKSCFAYLELYKADFLREREKDGERGFCK